MSFWDDYEETFYHVKGSWPKLMHLAKKDITCNRCGAPAYWQETIDKDGHPKIKLFSGGKPHVCPPPADDFTDVTGADLG